jgi:hypothetical protein
MVSGEPNRTSGEAQMAKAPRLLHSIPQVSDLTGLSRTTIFALIASGALPSIGIGTKRGGVGRRFIADQDLRTFIDLHRTTAA